MSLKIKAPFDYPVTQTILPVILPSGQIKGFLPIGKTTFTEPETTVETPDGAVVAYSITLPPNPSGGGSYRVSQYAAIYVDWKEAAAEPWTGFSNFISVNETGYFNGYTLAAGGMINHFSWGTVLHCLIANMDDTFGAESPIAGNCTTPQDDGTIKWSATVNMDTMSKLTFFDFGWYNLVVTKMQIPGFASWKKPAIRTTASPLPQFKATVVQGQAPQPGCFFDSVRIIKLAQPTPGEYVFGFTLYDAASPVSPSVHATLTLKVE